MPRRWSADSIFIPSYRSLVVLQELPEVLFIVKSDIKTLVEVFRFRVFVKIKTAVEKIDAPAVERRLNFHPEQVKIVKDMEKHITYR